MSFLQRLQKRWNLKNIGQVIIVLLVFAATGFTVLFLKRPVLGAIDPEIKDSVLFSIVYYIVILPFYNLILLIYGFLAGQFSFFWEFEKKFFKRIFRRK